MLAPIVLFVYNRPEHARRTVEALQKNDLADKSDLIIFSDGPKGNGDIEKVNDVRSYLKTISGFKSVEIIERTENLGLAKSIINGVTEIVNKYGKIVVLEDDLVTSPYFLKYMNDSLEIYENDDKVISIHGYVYPVRGFLPDTFFLRGADCWGWGTWKRGWDLFERDGQKLLKELRRSKLEKFFDVGGYPYVKMLENQIIGLNDSWAIRWRASAFLNNKYTLYPGKSLVKNIGFDSSGANSGRNNYMDVELANHKIFIEFKQVKEDTKVMRKLIIYFFKLGLLIRFKGVLKKLNIL